jgi:hypothetical protein
MACIRFQMLLPKILFFPFDNRILLISPAGASYHTAGISSQYKKAMRVGCLDWPPQSPDLAPIENSWRIAKDRVTKRRHRIRNIEEMGNAIIEDKFKFFGDLLSYEL